MRHPRATGRFFRRPRPRTLKLLAVGYLLKSLALGAAWYAVPDLPAKLGRTVTSAWNWLAGP